MPLGQGSKATWNPANFRTRARAACDDLPDAGTLVPRRFMQISGLTLANFRCFEFIELSLSPSFTLLLGDNGAGKTALLEGLAVALGAFVGEIRDAQSRNIREADDARHVVFDLNGVPDLQTQWPVRVAVLGTLFGERIGWARELSGTGGKTTRKESADLHESTEAAGRLIRRGKPIELPVLAFYGTQRLWVLKKATEAKRGVGSRLDGYIDCLAPASNVRLMAQWMYQQTLADLQAGAPSAQLAALERSVCLCLGDVTRFWFDIRHHEVRLQFVDGKVTPFFQLSDGYRNVIALVADLAWRAAVLNPHHGAEAGARAVGIVLIDEIDLHLHPAWQRRIVPDLRRAFPGLQFVATTHSPQVVASVHRHEVRQLAGGEVLDQQDPVEGRDSNSLLEDIFGVPSRPTWAAERLARLFDLIDQDQLDAARSELRSLESLLGADDADLTRARWLLDREARE